MKTITPAQTAIPQMLQCLPLYDSFYVLELRIEETKKQFQVVKEYCIYGGLWGAKMFIW